MSALPENLEKADALSSTLIDAKRANPIIEPSQDDDGFWFGGGNAVRDPHDGSLLLIVRYRDAGDSRTGLTQGTRGRELAIFRSLDNGRSFEKINSWDKSDLYCGSTVLSIEGSALRVTKRRVEVLVSTEKVRTYPNQLRDFQKPGTGIWSIDRFSATRVEKLAPQERIQPLLTSSDPAYLHVKDPSISSGFQNGRTLLIYCAHPYTWSSSTSGCGRCLAIGRWPTRVHACPALIPFGCRPRRGSGQSAADFRRADRARHCRRQTKIHRRLGWVQ